MSAIKKLKTVTRGEGPHIVLVHGWGVPSGIWDDVAARLAKRFQVTRIDMPGYGESGVEGKVEDYNDLTQLSERVASAVSVPALWIGWSLGGMVAATIAVKYPAKAIGLMMVASNAKFIACQDEDWPGISEENLTQFAEELSKDYHGTLNRFLSLQVKGSEGAHEKLRALRALVEKQKKPEYLALRGGLSILLNTDLRPLLGRIRCPVQQVFGERDVIVPQSAAKRSEWLYPGLKTTIIEKAGHAPFISHPTKFVAAVEDFYEQRLKHHDH